MQTGDLVGDRYQLMEQVQSSWLALDQISGRRCVLKPVAGFADARVAEWLGQVWHPGLPRLLDRVTVKISAEDPAPADLPPWHPLRRPETACGPAYYVFEYCAGQSLRALAAAKGGRLPAADILPLASQAAGILAYLHEQSEQPVLHLDIKPEHLLLEADGQVSLIDFGAARIGAPATDCRQPMPAECQVALTPAFAAPEQLAGQHCPGSDVYAMALVVLHLLTGMPPHACRTYDMAELIPDANPALQNLLARCLQPNPALRHVVACDLQAGLAAAVDLPNQALASGDPAAVPDLCHDDCESVKASGAAPAAHRRAELLCVWDGAEFGCEMAAVLAEQRHVLVIDANQLDPRADLLLDCRSGNNHGARTFVPEGLDLALLEEQRGRLDAARLGRLAQSTGLPRVQLLATRAGMDHYDYFSLDSLQQVLKLSRVVCDVAIVLCSRFVFDAFSCLSLLMSDDVLIPRPGDSGAFRETNRSLDLLASRYPLDPAKLHFVGFAYRPGVDLSKGTLDALCQGRLLGCISERLRRHSMKSGAIPYAAALDRVNRQEYSHLLRRLAPQSGHRSRSMQMVKEALACLW